MADHVPQDMSFDNFGNPGVENPRRELCRLSFLTLSIASTEVIESVAVSVAECPFGTCFIETQALSGDYLSFGRTPVPPPIWRRVLQSCAP